MKSTPIVWTGEFLDQIEERVVDGETIKSIADELGVSTNTVLRRFGAAGRESPAKVFDRKRRDLLADATWLTHQYIVDQRTIRQVAAALHIADTAVKAALDHHGIQRETHDDAIVAEFERGSSIRAITRDLGVDRDVVRRVLRTHGLHDGAKRIGPAALADPRHLRRWHQIEDMSVTAIAEKLGVSTASVKRAMHRHAIPIQHSRGAHSRLRDRDWLERRHLDDHRTKAEIAAELDVSPTTVLRAFKRHGIKRPVRALLDDRRWLRDMHRRDDISISRLARWMRVDRQVVVAALVAQEIPVRTRPNGYRPGSGHLAEVDWLSERFVFDGASIEQIASQTRTGFVAVRQALRDSGIRRSDTPS